MPVFFPVLHFWKALCGLDLSSLRDFCFMSQTVAKRSSFMLVSILERGKSRMEPYLVNTGVAVSLRLVVGQKLLKKQSYVRRYIITGKLSFCEYGSFLRIASLKRRKCQKSILHRL